MSRQNFLLFWTFLFWFNFIWKLFIVFFWIICPVCRIAPIVRLTRWRFVSQSEWSFDRPGQSSFGERAMNIVVSRAWRTDWSPRSERSATSTRGRSLGLSVRKRALGRRACSPRARADEESRAWRQGGERGEAMRSLVQYVSILVSPSLSCPTADEGEERCDAVPWHVRTRSRPRTVRLEGARDTDQPASRRARQSPF